MSWWQLVSWRQEAVETKTALDQGGPLSCPNDGEPLLTAPDGGLFCRFDGWRPEHSPGKPTGL